jgi:hypothetical protein
MINLIKKLFKKPVKENNPKKLSDLELLGLLSREEILRILKERAILEWEREVDFQKRQEKKK